MFKVCKFGRMWLYKADRAQQVDVMHGILLKTEQLFIYEMDSESGVFNFDNNLAERNVLERAYASHTELCTYITAWFQGKIRSYEEDIAECQRRIQLLEK